MDITIDTSKLGGSIGRIRAAQGELRHSSKPDMQHGSVDIYFHLKK